MASRVERPAGGPPPAQVSAPPVTHPYRPLVPGRGGGAADAPSGAALSALARECKQLGRMRRKGELPVGIDVAPKGDDLFQWAACVHGPPGSPYEGGLWNLDVNFPYDYPMSPPKIRFRTPIYHPNINPDGRICLDVTGGHTGRDYHKAWSAALTIDKVLLQIVAMLSDPNFNDPWVPMSPEQWRRNAALETREKAGNEESHVPQLDGAVPESPKKVAALDAHDLEEDDDGDLDCDSDSDMDEDAAPGGVYADELATLRSLGVQDSDDVLREALVRCRGNVSDVFEQLAAT